MMERQLTSFFIISSWHISTTAKYISTWVGMNQQRQMDEIKKTGKRRKNQRRRFRSSGHEVPERNKKRREMTWTITEEEEEEYKEIEWRMNIWWPGRVARHITISHSQKSLLPSAPFRGPQRRIINPSDGSLCFLVHKAGGGGGWTFGENSLTSRDATTRTEKIWRGVLNK